MNARAALADTRDPVARSFPALPGLCPALADEAGLPRDSNKPCCGALLFTRPLS